jgi:two-component system alkaline phosphatase synthesis response regulator PhoP
VVEDESPLGEMICDNLGLEGHGTELVKDGRAAAARIARGGLDLVILDVMLPHRDGFDVLREMRARGDTTPVLVLSARSSDADRIRGLELRADDYLTKPFNLKELLLRVGALLRRAVPANAGVDVLEFGGNRVDYRAHRAVRFDGSEVSLSDRELRLLRLLAGRQGAVVSRREVVDALFGPATPVTTRTLDNLVASLRKAFERDTHAPRHLHTLRGVGWRLSIDGEG